MYLHCERSKSRYSYGTCLEEHSRKDVKNGKIEFLIRRANEGGKVVDSWSEFSAYEPLNFKEYGNNKRY
ncbi:hypothetical protein JHD46_05485 [Sulfurimonas sp. SAG-AH-194-C20]|nr:hypothetical protein [Sulfurimonas sp. SAG-AH-194-C20]MDF1879092.1 hypothetical protein [Sulfurimonas sp. SAG-AH-194-C20]